jgi:threonine/homoserine/homoserine lactone efflux protein
MVSVPCMACWAWLGAYSARVVRSPRAMRRFNRAMAVLLLIAAWSSLLTG